jgi:hypothetical protein
LFSTQLVDELNGLNSTAGYKDKASYLMHDMFYILGEYTCSHTHKMSEIQAVVSAILSKTQVNTSDQEYLNLLMEKIAAHELQS